MSEIPSYSFEQVFKPERAAERNEALALEQIDAQQVLELAEFVDQGVGQYLGAISNEPNQEDPSTGMLRQTGQLLRDYDHPLQKAIIKSFWLAGPIFGQGAVREQMANRLDDLEFVDVSEETEAEKEQIFNQLNEMNIVSASWQTEAAKMILALRNSPEGQQVLGSFWQNMQNTAEVFDAKPQDFEGYRRGIEGVVATCDIFDKLGFETFFAFARQDAIEKIDLWAKKDETVLALQIKTHRSDTLRVKIERVRRDTGGQLPAERQHRKLLNSCQKYSQSWQKKVLPFWVDLDRAEGGHLMRQDKNLNLITDDQMDFAQLAEEVGRELEQE